MRASSDDPVKREKALTEICSLYWPPLYAFIRARRHSPHDAEDLTQSLFASLLSRDDFARADSSRGKLRTYLLSAAKNYLNGEHRKEHRIKRGGETAILSIDAVGAEERCFIPEPMDNLTPDKVYERQWAITVMETVLSSLEKLYEAKQQKELFIALRPYVTVTTAPAAGAELAAELGLSESALRVAIHRLKQRYKELFRQTVRETLSNDDDLDEEIATLIASFD